MKTSISLCVLGSFVIGRVTGQFFVSL